MGGVFKYGSKENEIGDLKTQSGFTFVQSCMSFLTVDKFRSQQFSAALGQEISYAIEIPGITMDEMGH